MRTGRNSLLDLVRGVAALEVMLSHLRAFFFVDYGQVHEAGRLVQLFYYATGFGHQAVVVFFVLSGYLVGGSVLSAKSEGFGLRYGVQRLSRLWIVLLPCLVATVFWNLLGWHTGGAAFLSGQMRDMVNSGPQGAGISLTPLTFLGNAFFLQTISTAVLGDNGPLWSLANEFWYYVLFPLMIFGVWKVRGLRPRVFCLGLTAILLLVLPRELLVGYIIWLAGAFIQATGGHRLRRVLASLPVGGAALVLSLWLFHRSRYGGVSDLWLGVTFAVALPLLFRLPELPRRVAAWAAWLSDFSYTLYLSHFSLAAFVWYTWLGAHRVHPALASFALYLGIASLLIVYAYLMSLVFERNTDKVRRWGMELLAGRARPTTPAGEAETLSSPP